LLPSVGKIARGAPLEPGEYLARDGCPGAAVGTCGIPPEQMTTGCVQAAPVRVTDHGHHMVGSASYRVDDVHVRSIVRFEDQDVHIEPSAFSVGRCDEVVEFARSQKWFVT